MSNFGDEFFIESYRFTWLIWINLLVMILLMIILFLGFSAFTSEPSSSSSAWPSDGAANAPPPHINNPSSALGRAKQEEVPRSRGDRVTREEVQNGEESSLKDSSIFRNPNHPCTYFGLAKRAVLKCLGLDSSSRDQHDKQE